MNIGEAARKTGISAKMIRYYEAIGLMPAVTRLDGGSRVYSTSEIGVLRYIKRARSLGFSLEQIGEILALWHHTRGSTSRVKALTLAHIES